MPRFPLERSGSVDSLPFTPRVLDRGADPEELRSWLKRAELRSWLPVPCLSVLACGLPRLPLLLCGGAQAWLVGGLAVDRPSDTPSQLCLLPGRSCKGASRSPQRGFPTVCMWRRGRGGGGGRHPGVAAAGWRFWKSGLRWVWDQALRQRE